MPEHPLPSDPTPTPPPEAVPLPTWQDWLKLDERLGRIEAGLAALNERVGELKSGTSNSFTGFGKRFDDIDKRFDDIDKHFDEIIAEIKLNKKLAIAALIATICIGSTIIALLIFGTIILATRLPAL